jgi:mannose-6-phosphate isomerase-like protein (cupin superfamily)
MNKFHFTELKDAPAVPFKLDGRILFSAPNIELVHLALKPGESMDKHSQPFDVLFFIIEGSGTLEIGDESINPGSGACVWVEAGSMRKWSNPGTAVLKILVIKELK